MYIIEFVMIEIINVDNEDRRSFLCQAKYQHSILIIGRLQRISRQYVLLVMLALNKYTTKVNAGLWGVYQFYIIFIFFFVLLETPGPVKSPYFVSLFKTGQAYRKYFETKHYSEQSLQSFI